MTNKSQTEKLDRQISVANKLAQQIRWTQHMTYV